MDRALFSRQALEALAEIDRTGRLRQLEAELASRLAGVTSADAFFRESYAVVDELKAMGHDLWSWDSDGESFEIWGGDYARPELAGRLMVTFQLDGGPRVALQWPLDPKTRTI